MLRQSVNFVEKSLEFLHVALNRVKEKNMVVGSIVLKSVKTIIERVNLLGTQVLRVKNIKNITQKGLGVSSIQLKNFSGGTPKNIWPCTIGLEKPWENLVNVQIAKNGTLVKKSNGQTNQEIIKNIQVTG